MSTSPQPFDPMEIKVPDRIESPRLLLRRYQLSDALWLVDVFKQERERLKNDFPARIALVTEADTEAFLAHLLHEWRCRSALYFAVWDKLQREYIGEVGVKDIVWSIPKGDLGYFVVRKAEGKGMATEAVSLLVEFAFDVLHMRKLQIRCAADNVRSRRGAERCGFTYEGLLRYDAVRPDGQLIDLMYFGMTDADRALRKEQAPSKNVLRQRPPAR
jgi:RimJ/RimL family protein N-acetyltransferase